MTAELLSTANLDGSTVTLVDNVVEAQAEVSRWMFRSLGDDDDRILDYWGETAIEASADSSLELHNAQTDVGIPQLEGKLQVFRRIEYSSQPSYAPIYVFERAFDHPSNPLKRYFVEFQKRYREVHRAYRHYWRRIHDLRGYGKEDGILINESSERDFWAFVGSAGFTRRAGLALMDSGNLRAVWKDDDESHLGLHFLGDQTVNYVIFKWRSGVRRISRVAGNDTFDGVKRQIHAFDLTSLVNK